MGCQETHCLFAINQLDHLFLSGKDLLVRVVSQKPYWQPLSITISMEPLVLNA